MNKKDWNNTYSRDFYYIDPETTAPCKMMLQFMFAHEWAEKWFDIVKSDNNTLTAKQKEKIKRGLLMYADQLRHRYEELNFNEELEDLKT